MDETDIKVAGPQTYRYRAADRDGNTPAFLLRTKQDGAAARRFPARAINPHGVPENIGIDTSGANTATIESSQSVRGNGIQMRQLKGLNNLVEPDHRATKNPCAPCSD